MLMDPTYPPTLGGGVFSRVGPVNTAFGVPTHLPTCTPPIGPKSKYLYIGYRVQLGRWAGSVSAGGDV
jgi:hypothetical protein